MAFLVSQAVDDPRRLVEYLAMVRSSGWLLPAYLALFGATTFLAPAFTFFVVAGALWGFWPGCAVGWVAANAWSNAHFAAGRLLGRARVRRWLEAPRLAGARRELEHGGALAVVVVRQLPLPFVGVNVVAGASPLRWPRWAVGNAVGLAPAAAGYAWSSASILAGASGARGEAAARVVGAAAVVLLFGLASRWLARRMAARWTDRGGRGA